MLIVDDNRAAADSLGLLLEMIGNDVQVVHDGAAAVERADSFRPYLILAVPKKLLDE